MPRLANAGGRDLIPIAGTTKQAEAHCDVAPGDDLILIRLRWLAIGGAAVAFLLFGLLMPGALTPVRLMAVVAFAALYNGLFHLLSRAGHPAAQLALETELGTPWNSCAQFVLDLLSLTALLHVTGGIESPLWPLYVLSIIVAGTHLSRTAAYTLAGLASVLYAGMGWLEYAGLIQHVSLAGLRVASSYRQTADLLAMAVACALTLFLVAFAVTLGMERTLRRVRRLVADRRSLETQVLELSEKQRQVARAEEERNRFLVLATHELRAPVAAVLGYLRLIQSGSVPADRLIEAIGRAERRATELLDRTSDVLVLSGMRDRFSAVEIVDLGDVLNEVLGILLGAIESKRLMMCLDVSIKTPAILISREQIRQVWMNLISNAIKYTPPGGRIEVCVSQNGDHVVGMVRDSGIGILNEEQTRIFEGFYRTESARRMEQYGTGLGLCIVKQIIESRGGRIEVASSPGQGATFTFALPLESRGSNRAK